MAWHGSVGRRQGSEVCCKAKNWRHLRVQMYRNRRSAADSQRGDCLAAVQSLAGSAEGFRARPCGARHGGFQRLEASAAQRGGGGCEDPLKIAFPRCSGLLLNYHPHTPLARFNPPGSLAARLLRPSVRRERPR